MQFMTTKGTSFSIRNIFHNKQGSFVAPRDDGRIRRERERGRGNASTEKTWEKQYSITNN